MVTIEESKKLSFLIVSLAILLLLAIMPAMTIKDTIRFKEVAAQTPDDFRFAAVGDWGCKADTNAMASVMASKNPEIVLGLGDYSYETKMTCWHDILMNFPTIHEKIHLYDSLAFGNHEDDACVGCGSGTNLDAEGEAEYLAHFNQPPTFFSFDHKRVHFVALDSQSAPYDANSEQYAFISNDLNQTKQRIDNGTVDWVVVFMHHPMYTSCIADCSHHGNMTGIRAVYQPLFDSYGVDLVLQGHVHAYERMKPMKYDAIITHPDTFDYVNPRGQVYITVGTGGQSLYEYSTKPEMSVTQIETFGFLQLDITRTSLIGRFVDNSDTVMDGFIIVKIDESLPSPPTAGPPPPLPSTITDVWASSHNTADFANSFQKMMGEKITDTALRGLGLESTTIYIHKSNAVSAAGSLRGVLLNYDTDTVIATSTNSISRSSIVSGYNPYIFNFPSGTTTPAGNNFFIGVECVSCDGGKVYVGAYKDADPYPNGNLVVLKGGSWVEWAREVEGSATYLN